MYHGIATHRTMNTLQFPVQMWPVNAPQTPAEQVMMNAPRAPVAQEPKKRGRPFGSKTINRVRRFQRSCTNDQCHECAADLDI